MPQHAAGSRMEPVVSVPSATSARPLATATAEPLEEPPGMRRRFAGERVARRAEELIEPRRCDGEFAEIRLPDELDIPLAGDF